MDITEVLNLAPECKQNTLSLLTNPYYFENKGMLLPKGNKVHP